MGAPLEPLVGSFRRPPLAASRGSNPAAPEVSSLAFDRAKGQAPARFCRSLDAAREQALAPRPPRPYKACSLTLKVRDVGV